MEEYMLATIQSAALLGRRALAKLQRYLARLTDLQRDGMTAWHFF
jgi:hypothetical protein